MPERAAASTIPLTALAPCTWPALRGMPRRCAQRPLPSMMIATCRVIARSRSQGRLDDRLDVLEITVERLAAHGRQPVLRLRPPSGEGFGALDVACLLELARMGAQVAVADIEQRLQLVESELRIHGERAHDAEPHPLVDQAVEFRILAATVRNGRRRRLASLRFARFGRSHHCLTPSRDRFHIFDRSTPSIRPIRKPKTRCSRPKPAPSTTFCQRGETSKAIAPQTTKRPPMAPMSRIIAGAVIRVAESTAQP